MFRNILFAALALGVLGGSALAQDFIPVESIQYAGRYDLRTNTFHPSSIDPDGASYQADATVLFNNSTTNGSLTTASGAIATHHFVDWGTANFGGGGASITEIRIGYGTNLLATSGTVNLRIRLYQGTSQGVLGTVIGDYQLNGLPNSTSGGFQGYTVDVTLPTALSMADGAIGWSYNSDATVTTSTGPLLVGPPNETGVENVYDRYLESTDGYIGSFWFGGAPFASFVMRLTGRANTPPVLAWENYGVKKVVTLTGEGPGAPDTPNQIDIKSTVPGKPVVLVVGIVQSDFYQPTLDLRFYALPWLVMLGPWVPDPLTATVSIPFVMPSLGTVTPGDEIFFQAFGQNLAAQWKNWSKGLKLTIQAP